LCHCERSAAIHDCAFSTMDRHTSFAMTNRGRDRMRRRGAERAKRVLGIWLLVFFLFPGQSNQAGPTSDEFNSPSTHVNT
ncbi:hypothetical protein, partial [Polaromonas sp.]|uniref:hypothetical protein n=1 Tax=Polaromonas sp. TaxID=1869339 RepID=UPI0025EAE7F1